MPQCLMGIRVKLTGAVVIVPRCRNVERRKNLVNERMSRNMHAFSPNPLIYCGRILGTHSLEFQDPYHKITTPIRILI